MFSLIEMQQPNNTSPAPENINRKNNSVKCSLLEMTSEVTSHLNSETFSTKTF